MTRVRWLFATLLLVSCFIAAAWFVSRPGRMVHSLNGVPVYANGFLYWKSHGRHLSSNGYNYGMKWQCVEFVKRYYAVNYHHYFPDSYGNAIDFFDAELSSGRLNKKRNLIQFENGGADKPVKGDILVFIEPSPYGHVAIVSNVYKHEIEVVQQNVLFKPIERFDIIKKNNSYFVKGRSTCLGWLRRAGNAKSAI